MCYDCLCTIEKCRFAEIFYGFLMALEVLTCEQYATSLKLLAVRADSEAIQYQRRYVECNIEIFLFKNLQINEFLQVNC
jgi:hypothetical protein